VGSRRSRADRRPRSVPAGWLWRPWWRSGLPALRGEKQRWPLARRCSRTEIYSRRGHGTLDSESEVAVQAALAQALTDPDIAGDRAPPVDVLGADKILVVDEGASSRAVPRPAAPADGLYAESYRTSSRSKPRHRAEANRRRAARSPGVSRKSPATSGVVSAERCWGAAPARQLPRGRLSRLGPAGRILNLGWVIGRNRYQVAGLAARGLPLPEGLRYL